MRITVAFATLFAALSVLALPLTHRDSYDPSLSLRSDDAFCAEAIFYTRALTAAQRTAKVAKATIHKAAGLATQKSKTKVQAQSDRKDRKKQQAINKAAKVVKAKAKNKADPKTYLTHEQKIKSKATVTFSSGAAKRLDGMGLHGKARQAAKKFHKNIMLAAMKKNGATKGTVVAPAHKGGTVADEKNHLTVNFYEGVKRGDESKGAMPSTWIDKATGKVMVGEQHLHHVYVNDKLRVPTAWSNAVDASLARTAAAGGAADAAKKAKWDAKVKEAKLAGSSKKGISPEEKKAQREAAKAEKAARKKRPDAT